MTKEERIRQQGRERARRHYEKKKQAALAVVPEEEEEEQEQELREDPFPVAKDNLIPKKQAPLYKKQEIVDYVPEPKGTRPSVYVPFALRSAFVIFLTGLLTYLQVSFYEKYDVSPGLAWAFALSTELCLLSLISMRFAGKMDWVRVALITVIFGYLFSTMAFLIWQDLEVKSVPQNAEQLASAEAALAAATKGRSWENMKIFGEEVVRLRNMPVESAGNWINVALLAMMRLILLCTSSLNSVRLRDSFVFFSDKTARDDS